MFVIDIFMRLKNNMLPEIDVCIAYRKQLHPLFRKKLLILKGCVTVFAWYCEMDSFLVMKLLNKMWCVLTKWVVCQLTWFRENTIQTLHNDFCHQSILYLFCHFSFILLLSTFYNILGRLRNISRMNLVRQNRKIALVRVAFFRVSLDACMMDIFGTRGQPRTSSVWIW